MNERQRNVEKLIDQHIDYLIENTTDIIHKKRKFPNIVHLELINSKLDILLKLREITKKVN